MLPISLPTLDMTTPIRLSPQTLREQAAAVHGETAIVKELLAALETATPAGQQYLMNKVVDLLRRESVRVVPRSQDRRAISGTIEDLGRQAERRSPDAAAFTRGTVRLLAALSRA